MELTNDIRQAIKMQLTARPKTPLREHVQVRSAGAWVRPYPSEALGVSPEDIPRAREYLRKHGIAAEFDEDGCCLVTSDKQYRDIAKASGIRTGRDGYQTKDYSGKPILSGRQPAEGKAAFRRAVERGEVTF